MTRRSRLEETSDALVDAAKDVKLLSALSWPNSAAAEFIAGWEAGSPKAPELPPRGLPGDKVREALRDVETRCDHADPLGRYLADSARSYRLASELIDQTGTPAFHKLSRELYGGSNGTLRGSTMCHREAANRLMESTAAMAFVGARHAEYCVTAQSVESALESEWSGFFAEPIRFVIDDKLNAKAAASATRVRLRAGTCFSKYDAAQLSAHEVGVHSLTSLNGRAQTVIRALGLGAPRTTATQEGLATFAEVVTGAVDLSRLRRIALRIEAIGLVEDGADFVQLFERLVELGEAPLEAVNSTMRVFRGADPNGRYPFTKDVVYLKGLFSAHTFLRKAIAEHRIELVPRLFIGRVTLADVLRLDGECGELLDEPRYLPKWADDLPSLAAFLAFSALSNDVDLSTIELADFASDD